MIQDTLAQDRGRRRIFEHMRNQGEQVETLWESGKTISHLTQEEGQDTWNKREVSDFQNKTGNDETRHESKRKSASLGERESLFVIVHSPLCFRPGVERVFSWIIFIAALSSTIVIEERASGVSQPFYVALSGDPQPALLKINILTLNWPCICVLCPEAVTVTLYIVV